MAIIGGGMAGLVCALNLEARGVKSTVFDTVRLLGTLPLIGFQFSIGVLGVEKVSVFRCFSCCNLAFLVNQDTFFRYGSSLQIMWKLSVTALYCQLGFGY